MVGIDIVEVERIKKAIEKNSNFPEKILTKAEIMYLNTKPDVVVNGKFSPKIYTLAGFFAAKEAILKSFGVGVGNGYGFLDIEVNHTKMGAPTVKLSEKLQNYAKNNNFGVIFLSISHDGNYAIAQANLEKSQK